MKDTLHLNVHKKWFDAHQVNKYEEYRDITPYWCQKLLVYKGKRMKSSFWKEMFKRFDTLEIMMDKVEQVQFKLYEDLTFSNGMKSKDILPRFQKHHFYTSIGFGDSELGATTDCKVFVIQCGLVIFNAKNL